MISLPLPIALPFMVGALALLIWLAAARRRAQNDIAQLTADNQTLRNLVDYDPLTRCYSRRYFMAQVRLWVDPPDPNGLALMILDIDHFKTINDNYGHVVGDRYLARVGAALIARLGRKGIVARLGGDEFWIALPRTPRAEADAIAADLCALIYTISVHTPSYKVTRSASIGVTHVRGAAQLADVMAEADTALYLAKAGGRNRAMMVDDGLRARLADTPPLPTVERIRHAIATDQFTYFVQPIFDIQNDRPVGVEALIRWVRDDGHVLLPADFMPVMTDNYHMALKPPVRLANEVATAFSAAHPPLYCAFNISTTFLQRALGQDPGWLDDLLAGLDPSHTVFEIVESAVIEDAARTTSLLHALRARGARIALDDFGTGHSNLMRLHDLPVDIVKIDRGFVSTLPQSRKNVAILRALVSMAQDLHFDIIAEGVETPDQLACVRALGIQYAQGFLLGAPAPLADWQDMLLGPEHQTATAAE